MSWITIIWSMAASACLTIGAVHLLVWLSKRTAWASLLFSLFVTAVAAMSAIELLEMRAETPGQLAALYRWYQVPIWVVTLTSSSFVWVHLHAGRPWLWWAASGSRTITLVLNFLIGQNLNYLEITHVRHIRFLGESVSRAAGVLNHWMIIGQFSVLLFVVFVADAGITVWRRGDRWQALIISGSLLAFLATGLVHGTLVFWQILDSPMVASIFCLIVVAAMGYEMTRDVLRAGVLAEDLRESEKRFRATFEQAAMGIADVSPEGRFLRVNQRLCEIAGYSHADAGARPFQEITYPEDLAADLLGMKQLLSGERDAISLEKRYIRKDSELVWVHLTAALVRDEAGHPQWFIAAIEDIDSRKQVEEKVRQLSHALESGPVLVVITDLRGAITYVNRKFCDANGRLPRRKHRPESSLLEVRRVPSRNVCGPVGAYYPWGNVARGIPQSQEEWRLHWESAVISPLLDADGRATHFVGVKLM